MKQAALQQAMQAALQHHQANRLGEAEHIYRQVLAAKPNDVDALHLLGVLANQTGRYAVAVELIERAIAIVPDSAEMWSNLGGALKNLGNIDAAIAAFGKAIDIKPDFASLHFNLGNILLEQGRFSDSITRLSIAIKLKPDYVRAYCALGNALKDIGDLAGAVNAYSTAMRLEPNDAPVHSGLANCLWEQGAFDDAIIAARRAIELMPDYAEAHANLANALKSQKQFDEAVTEYSRAIQIKPDLADAYNNLAALLTDLGQLDEAIAASEKAIALKPDSPRMHTNLLYALYHHPDYDASQLLARTRQWADRHASPPAADIVAYAEERHGERRLKIGYLSTYFRASADSHFIVPLLANHDRNRFEIFCYSRAVGDAVTQSMRVHADYWKDVRYLSDEAAAALIRRDQIDILVNISPPACDCLLVLARKPAPIQITWLTFASCTTGMKTVGYRLSDPWLDPAGSDVAYSEKTIRLPKTAWCYDPLSAGPSVNSLPALAAGHITFGCFNRFSKLNPRVRAAFAAILKEIPGSRLHLLADPGSHRQRVLDDFLSHGIDARRIEFVPTAPRDQYLFQYHRIDIALDPFPFSGQTTSLDSLWMGVPVVTLAGRTSAGRAVLGALHHLSLDDWIAQTVGQYVAIAVHFAADLSNLSKLRENLRANLQASPVMDGRQFARDLESIYVDLQRQPCD